MNKELIKGNEAIAKAALLSGCTHYFGYPITPSSEIIHACANFFPRVGASFIQAESEIAAINMVYGAAGCGRRVMTASSGPGISLKQEGVSYLAGAELPCVIVDIMRAGPGLGNIWPEQGDYNQIVKGGGHGNYKVPVLAPNTPQEMCDLTIKAFELADKYRTPVYLLADAYIGQEMGAVEFPKKVTKVERKDWAVYSDKESSKNLISSIYMSTEILEGVNERLQEKYKKMQEEDVLCANYLTDDAELIVVAYGVTARIAHNAIDKLREKGLKVGLFRPITLMPFPKKEIREFANNKNVKAFCVLELSNGQMLDDVRLEVEGTRPVDFYGRMGGAIPGEEEIADKLETCLKEYAL